MAQFMYRTGLMQDQPIEKREIVTRTPSYVGFYESPGQNRPGRNPRIRRERIRSSYANWYETWDEAHKTLLDAAAADLPLSLMKLHIRCPDYQPGKENSDERPMDSRDAGYPRA